jgi:hypothetical protein
MVKLPKPIIREILKYLDIFTFCINPIQMLQLMTIGIESTYDALNASKYRKKILDDYFNRISYNVSYHSIKSYMILDNKIYNKIYSSRMDALRAAYFDTNNPKIYEEQYEKYKTHSEIVNERWRKMCGQEVLSKSKEIYIWTNAYNCTGIKYEINYAYMPSLCPDNNDSKCPGFCDYCICKLNFGKCSGIYKVDYLDEIKDMYDEPITFKIHLETAKRIFYYLKSLNRRKYDSLDMKDDITFVFMPDSEKNPIKPSLTIYNKDLNLYKNSHGFVMKSKYDSTYYVVGRDNNGKMGPLLPHEIERALELGLEIL